ncbi:hypothetical protein KA005_61095 [bacterium]|nr:hypothetical protein [bacterium]
MNKEVRFLFVFVAIFIIALLSIMFGEKYTWTLPAPVPVGAMIIGFWMFCEGITEVCRGRTEHIIYNQGHHSVREKDILKIPYHGTATDPLAPEVMIIAQLCGFDYFGFTMPGGKSDPILIYPSASHGKRQNNYVCYGNLGKRRFKELPRYVRETLKLFPNRVDPLKTPFFYGTTSDFDGTVTKDNLKLEERERESNRKLAEMEILIDNLFARDKKMSQANEKQYILGNVIKPKNEDEER